MGSTGMGSKRFSKVAKRLTAVSCLALSALSLNGIAFADFDDALRAYSMRSNGQIDQAKVAEALDLWHKYAVAGDVLSRQILGDLYSNQPVFTQPVSGGAYGVPLPEETGVIAQDNVKALAWYIIAATHDFDDYSQQPDFRQINARIRAQDRIPELKAVMTTEQVQAAEAQVVNVLASQSEFDLYRLGAMYQSGNGLPKDNVEALKYYKLATNRARNSNQSAAKAANFLLTIMTKEDIKKSENLAMEWEPPLPDALTTKSPRTIELENQLRLLGERQAALAIADLEQEFKGNDHLIQNALAALGLYLGDIDGKTGPETRNAIKKFQYILVEKDESLSVEEKADVATGTLTVMQKVALLKRAARVDHPQSQYIYGIMNAEGIGVPVDGAEAVKWLKKSAGFGYPLAHYALGKYYRDGIFGDNPVQPSKAEASYHLGQAAALGLDQAQKELVELNYEFNYTQD
ncbi:peptidoglycan-binding protein [Parvularcula sp. LCG005]|uniref:peptidoglycan-binding protein n=1 Tax=Parvularcula sp. LCG005 TaxID=3078805 RepID=UPI002943B85B|nr:peptidoglycan-binding protein [Parvularcula sp. LCG005]WOI52011.1 peptidoglycan-binding protein [Parvularcula sp. LCG005]